MIMFFSNVHHKNTILFSKVVPYLFVMMLSKFMLYSFSKMTSKSFRRIFIYTCYVMFHKEHVQNMQIFVENTFIRLFVYKQKYVIFSFWKCENILCTKNANIFKNHEKINLQKSRT